MGLSRIVCKSHQQLTCCWLNDSNFKPHVAWISVLTLCAGSFELWCSSSNSCNIQVAQCVLAFWTQLSAFGRWWNLLIRADQINLLSHVNSALAKRKKPFWKCLVSFPPQDFFHFSTIYTVTKKKSVLLTPPQKNPRQTNKQKKTYGYWHGKNRLDKL